MSTLEYGFSVAPNILGDNFYYFCTEKLGDSN